MREILRALRSPNYRLFFGGQAASLVGLWMQYTAQAWLVYRLTDSAAMVGVATFATQGPGLLLGPVAGALADRHDKRAILVFTQIVALTMSAVIGLLTITGHITAWLVIGLAFVAGTARALEVPTRQAFVPELVDLGDLANAIALNSALFNVARLVGPAFAGILIPLVGEGWCFLGNSLAGLVIVSALLAIRLAERHQRKVSGLSIFKEIRQGIAYARREPTIRGLLGLLLVTSAFGMTYGVLLPSFSRRVLGGGAETFSQLQVAIGAGALVAAVSLASRSRVEGLELWVTRANLAFGALLVALSFARDTRIAFTILVLVGFAFLTQLASTNTLLQTISPKELRGRVMSLYTTILLGIFPLAGLAAGAVADRVGETRVIGTCGVIVVTAALSLSPYLRAHAGDSLAAVSAASPDSG